MQKVVRVPLICKQTDCNGNEVDYKKIYELLWDLQRQTREIKNRTVQLCWEFLNYSSDYANNHITYEDVKTKDGKIEKKAVKHYPSEKDTLGYTLEGYVYDNFKTGYDLYSSNASTTTRETCKAFHNARKEILSGERSVMSFKKNQPLDLHNKAITITCQKNKDNDDEFYADLKLLNQSGKEKNKMKNSTLHFVMVVKDKSTRTILERIINTEYGIGASKLIYNEKKHMWELNLSYAFEATPDNRLEPDKILGVDLGIHYPICASVYGSLRRFTIERNQIDEFRQRIESRKRPLLRQGKYCGEGRIGHGRDTRIKPVEKLRDKISNFRDTVNHAYSKQLVDYAVKNQCGIIQMEKLTGLSESVGKKNKDNEYLQPVLKNWSYFDLQTKITYKAKAKGIKVILIEPKYTSQRCSKCGYIDKENRPIVNGNQTKFECKACGFSENADYNASQNIALPNIENLINNNESAKQKKS